MQSCGFEESTHARYIHLKWKPRTRCICSVQRGVSKAKAIYLMHTGISGQATKIILFDACSIVVYIPI